MAAENIKSTPITNLDAQPIIVATAGEGLPGLMRAASDYAASVAFTTAATYRLCRFPTTAKIKRVDTYVTGVEIATGTANAATLDFNVAFSDSTTDGTPVSLIGTIPSNKLDGTSWPFNTGTGYTTAYTNTGTGNKMFGAGIALPIATTAYWSNLTFQGIFKPAYRDDDLWNVLGFTNAASGVAQDPGGKFDIFVVAAHAAGTAGTNGTIAVEIDYVI